MMSHRAPPVWEAKKPLPAASLLGNTNVATRYVLRNTLRDFRGCAIGLTTVLLVVVFVSLLQNVIQKSPIIFFKLSENTVGEIDVQLAPKSVGNSTSLFLNSSEITQLLANTSRVHGCAPRWTFLTDVLHVANTTGGPPNATNASSSASSAAPASPNATDSAASVAPPVTCVLLVMDLERERTLDIGREWDKRPIGIGEAYVSDDVLDRMSAATGDVLRLRIDPANIMSEFGVGSSAYVLFASMFETMSGIPLHGEFVFPLPIVLPWWAVNATTMHIPDFVNITKEQLAEAIDRVVIPMKLPPFNTTELWRILPEGPLGGKNITIPGAGAMLPDGIEVLPDGTLAFVIRYNMSDMVNETTARILQELIIDSNFTVVGGIGSPRGKFPSALGNITGLFANSTSQYNPSKVIASLNRTVNMLAQVNNTNITIDMNHYALNVVIQATRRARIYMKSKDGRNSDMAHLTNNIAESLGTGYPAAFTTPISAALEGYSFFRLFLDQIFTFTLVVMLFLSGMLIYSLLLSDVESKTYEYGMLRALGMPNVVLVELLAIQSVLFSVPEVTVTVRKLENLGLSPPLFAVSLLIVIFGFIAYYLVPYSFTFSNYDIIVSKNLASHSRRNSKTAIMLTTSFSFIVFAGAVFALLASSLGDFARLMAASDIAALSTSFQKPLPEDTLTNFLRSQINSSSSIVKGFSYVSYPASSYGFIFKTQITTLAGFPYTMVDFYGVEKTYLRDSFDINAGLELGASIRVSTPLRLRVDYYTGWGNDTSEISFLAKARALVNRMPGFFFSAYQSMNKGSPVLMSMDQFQTLISTVGNVSGDRGSVASRPLKQKLIVHVRGSASQSDRQHMADALKSLITDDLTQVFEVKGLVHSVTDSLDMLNIFFLTVAAVDGALCFFVLWLSFAANVSENIWEFAVLRAVGLTATRVIVYFVIEAMCLVTACMISGASIGIVVAVVLTLQFNMFTQLPFTFAFPYLVFFVLLGIAVVIALLGSYLPAAIIRRRAIGSVLKAA
eukprot:m51a1_g6662 hypothetical protein (1014) ;mRNA; r:166914-171319